MKKLMIAVAIVCAAAMSQAASFTWSSSANMTKSDGSTVATEMNPAGTLALVYLGDTTDGWDWQNAGLEGAVVDSATPNFTTSMGKPVSATSKSFGFDMTDYGNGDVFGVVFKDANGKLFYLQNSKGNITDTYTITGLDDDKAQIADFVFASSAHWTTTDASAAVVNVPEPTSGLLLLLGVAGMALRRRRA